MISATFIVWHFVMHIWSARKTKHEVSSICFLVLFLIVKNIFYEARNLKCNIKFPCYVSATTQHKWFSITFKDCSRRWKGRFSTFHRVLNVSEKRHGNCSKQMLAVIKTIGTFPWHLLSHFYEINRTWNRRRDRRRDRTWV